MHLPKFPSFYGFMGETCAHITPTLQRDCRFVNEVIGKCYFNKVVKSTLLAALLRAVLFEIGC